MREEKKARFSAETLRFLRAARRQKDPAWLEKKRPVYERSVRQPFVEVIEAMGRRFQGELPQFRFSPRSLSRPMRQPDRADDKGLFKDYIACPMGPRKVSRFEYPPSFYLSIGADEIFFAAGLYRPSSPQMKAVRLAIARDPAALDRLVRRPAFRKLYRGLDPDPMVRGPKGFTVPPRYEYLLKRRSFTVHRSFTARELASPKFVSWVVRHAEVALPLVLWLNAAIGRR
jgi:uncharacterized protein (TIGR02453 family)